MAVPYLQNLVNELRENSRVTHWIREPSLVPTSFTTEPGEYIHQKRDPLRNLYSRHFRGSMAQRAGALLAINYTGAFQRSMVSFLQTPVMIMRNEIVRDAAQRGSNDKDVYSQVLKHIEFLLAQSSN